MEAKRTFVIQTLVVTLVLNAILLVTLYLLGGDALGAATLFGIGGALTLVLWFAIQWIGGRLLGSAAPAAAPEPALPKPAPKKELAPPSMASAIQMLSILQRRGRLIDFLQEDLSAYQDDQIGAAVRNIHEGCKQALKEYVDLEPIYSEAEGSQITVPPGFDAHAVRLTGNIMGDPPFKGALRHRGWRVVRVELPERVQEQEKILAAAEVEVGL